MRTATSKTWWTTKTWKMTPNLSTTATSTTAENQALSNSMYVHSIPNNNDNQDIVSMGTNSALMAKQVLENSFQVMSVHLMAICQGIDLLDDASKEKLSSKTKKVHQDIRKIASFVKDDSSQSEAIGKVKEYIKENNF